MTGTNKKTSQLVFFLLLLTTALVLITDFSKLHATSHDTWATPCTVTVEPGDTLWRIAARYTTDQQDIREVIWAIKKHNHLNSTVLYPGQTLVIPASSPSPWDDNFMAFLPVQTKEP